MGVSENEGYLILGVLIRRILLFRVLYSGPLFSETPVWFHEASLLGGSWVVREGYKSPNMGYN